MIQVNHLSFSYTKKPFIQDMSFSVQKREIFGFLGPSGAGKSTLQKILLGMLPDYQGSVVVNGTECRKHPADFYGVTNGICEGTVQIQKIECEKSL